ncbi:MAG: protein kinase [Coxiellaceae bacterium]|nr:protein kinase [Coxiellaceae bacterium]
MSRFDDLKDLDFTEQLSRLKWTVGSVVERDHDLIVVKIETRSGYNKSFQINKEFYLIDKEESVAQGAFGQVFNAYFIDLSTAKLLNTDKRFIAKEIPKNKLSEKMVEQEVRRTDVHHFTARVASTLFEKTSYIISEKLPGVPLTSLIPGTHEERLTASVATLGLVERLTVVIALLDEVQLTHNYTPSRGKPLIHSDIKGPNILVYVEPKRVSQVYARVTVNLIDFGISAEVPEDGGYTEKGGFSANYIGPERYNRHNGVKSDVYSLVPVIAYVLGATEVMSNKSQHSFKGSPCTSDHPKAKANFNLANIFTDLNVSDEQKERVISFMNGMQHSEYSERKSIDDCSKFFMGFQNELLDEVHNTVTEGFGY